MASSDDNMTILLTAAELAERWKLYRTDRKRGEVPNTGRIAYLIGQGELPNAFRLRAGGAGSGAREWRIPLADVLDFERRRRAAPAGGGETAPEMPKPRRGARPAGVTGNDGKSRLGRPRSRARG